METSVHLFPAIAPRAKLYGVDRRAIADKNRCRGGGLGTGRSRRGSACTRTAGAPASPVSMEYARRDAEGRDRLECSRPRPHLG